MEHDPRSKTQGPGRSGEAQRLIELFSRDGLRGELSRVLGEELRRCGYPVAVSMALDEGGKGITSRLDRFTQEAFEKLLKVRETLIKKEQNILIRASYKEFDKIVEKLLSSRQIKEIWKYVSDYNEFAGTLREVTDIILDKEKGCNAIQAIYLKDFSESEEDSRICNRLNLQLDLQTPIINDITPADEKRCLKSIEDTLDEISGKLNWVLQKTRSPITVTPKELFASGQLEALEDLSHHILLCPIFEADSTDQLAGVSCLITTKKLSREALKALTAFYTGATGYLERIARLENRRLSD